MKSVPILPLEIFDINVNLRNEMKAINQMRIEISLALEIGTYDLRVYSGEKSWQTNLMKL